MWYFSFENTEINSIQSTDVSNRYFVFCHTKICIRCLSQHHLISLILSEIERKEFFSKNSFLPQNSTNYHDPFNHEKRVKKERRTLTLLDTETLKDLHHQPLHPVGQLLRKIIIWSRIKVPFLRSARPPAPECSPIFMQIRSERPEVGSCAINAL